MLFMTRENMQLLGTHENKIKRIATNTVLDVNGLYQNKNLKSMTPKIYRICHIEWGISVLLYRTAFKRYSWNDKQGRSRSN